MRESLAMGLTNGFRHADQHKSDLLEGRLARDSPVAKVFAFDVFLDDIWPPVMLLYIMHRNEKWMLEVRCRACFVNEAFHLFGRLKPLTSEDLQGYRAIQSWIVSQVNDTKTAFAQLSLYFVTSDLIGN